MSAGASRHWSEVLRRGRATWVLLLGAGLLLAGVSAASAYWTVTAVLGPGSTALAQSASLSAPVSATAAQSSGSGTASIAFIAPGAQLPGALYRVTRSSGPGAGAVVCTTAVSPCADTGLNTGTSYSWTVAAVVGTSWQSAAVTASTTTLGVTTSSLPNGTVGTAYSTTLTRTSGTGPFTWSLTSGTLPTGLALDGSTGTISGTPMAAGTATGLQLTVTDSLGRTATSASLSLAVAKGSQTITFTSSPPATVVAGTTTYTPTATSPSGLTVSIAIDPSSSAVCTIASGVVSFAATGSCVINANQAGDADWNAAAQEQQTITVTQLGQTISFSTTAPTAAVAAGTPYVPAATATSGLAVVFTIDPSTASVCTFTAGTVTFQTIGTCKVNANQPGNGTYSAAPQVQQSFSVGVGVQTLSISVPFDAGVGGSYTPILTNSAGLGGTMSIPLASQTVCRFFGATVRFLTAGNCTISATAPATSNVTAGSVTTTFVIRTPAGLGIQFVSSTPGTALINCGAVTANRTCNVSGVGLSGSVTFSVLVLASDGNRVAFDYTNATTVTETGQNVGTASILAGTSISTSTLTAGHVGNATKTSVLTYGTYKLTINVST
jgi:large repetitive protein